MDVHYFLIAFDSTHAALEAEAFFNKKEIKAKLIPLPSAISAGCGFAIKILTSEIQVVKGLLTEEIFKSAKFYEVKKIKRITNIEKWVF